MFSRLLRSSVQTNRTTLLTVKPHRTMAKIVPSRSFHSTTQLLKFREWKTLSDDEKREFIHSFVALYKEKNGRTKNYYKQLASGMDEHDDIPAIFGLLYKDLVEKEATRASTAEFPEDFFDLLVKE